MKKYSKGFTLLELMIVLAIVGILATVAVPQYLEYTKRAKFSDVIAQTVPQKMAVGLCIQENNTLDPCDSGYGDISSITTPTGQVQSLSVSNGSITATGIQAVGGAVYKLDPVYDSTKNTLTWSRDDSIAKDCKSLGLCK